jgi:hypothetical protein
MSRRRDAKRTKKEKRKGGGVDAKERNQGQPGRTYSDANNKQAKGTPNSEKEKVKGGKEGRMEGWMEGWEEGKKKRR